MKIYLIRHGETRSNAARILQMPETPLSERGLAQAERLAQRLARSGIANILSSDLPRAAMTAERLATAVAAPIHHEPLLQERNFGDARGSSYDDLGGGFFDPDFTPRNGENLATFDARVARAWARVAAFAAAHAGDLAVVTHGLVCTSLAGHQLRLPEGEPPPLHFGNTAVTVVAGARPWSVSTLNCAAHLEDD